MYKRILKYGLIDKKVTAITLLAVLAISGIELMLPLFSKQVIGTLIPNNDINGIQVMLVQFIVLIFAYTIFNYIQGYYGHIWGLKVHQKMREDALQKIQRLPFDYFDKNKSGIIQTRIGPDLVTISEMIHHLSEDILSVSLVTIIGYVYLGSINLMLTTIIFLIIVVQIFIGLKTRKRMVKGFKESREATSEVYSVTDTNITGVRLTRAFANEQYELERFNQSALNQAQKTKTTYQGLGIFMASNNFFTMSMNVMVVGLGGIAVIQGKMNFADMLAFVVYFNLLLAPVRTVIRSFESLQEGIVGMRRFEVLMTEEEEYNAPNAIIPDKLKGDIKFDNVTFEYQKSERPVLKNISFDVKAGEMLALVGPSGAGKSTIAQLIPRFYEIKSGQILVDQIDIQSYDIHALRKNIGFVQQDVYIFWGSVAENIRYGKLDATQEEVINAAKKAGIHDFIMTMEEGYETQVGERGVKLSGGQKQRISLARIFLKNPSILILDEATSALDNITEQIIQENIEELTKNRTVIVVAHRLSTIKNANKILVLGDKGIDESGTHDQLIKNNGTYSKLYNSQFKEVK